MATEKRTGLDRAKVKTLEKLKEAGFDTAAKVRTLEARQMLKLGLASEMGNIFDLQDAIKANHSELAWLMEGEDPKPVKKEAAKNADENRKPAAEAGPRPFGFGNNRSSGAQVGG